MDSVIFFSGDLNDKISFISNGPTHLTSNGSNT